jgi:hypothetical protein
MKNKFVLVMLLLWSGSLFAQQALPVPAAVRAAYEKGTRHQSGIPGPRYWQNKGDYKLKVDFEPPHGG